MISIKNLNKTYASGALAVNQLSLNVSAGEILALLGPNGAGKSSTIRVLTTLSGFDEGEVTVAGFNVDSEQEKVRQSIGYVAQETGVDYFLTGRENLTLQGHLYRMTKKDITSRIDELANYFELTDVLDNLVSNYSGGMRRKLDIATALIHRPKTLFLDEPTLGLDTPSRQSLWQYIRKLNDEFSLTILLTTHYLEEADKLANRVAIIHKGQIKIIDKPEKLKDEIRGDVVSLQFSKPENKNQIAEALGRNDFVKDQKWEQDKLHLYVSNGATSIPRLIESCSELNCNVENVSYSRPTLDDVFIQYTGSSIDASESDSENKWWEKWAGKGGGGKWAQKWQEDQPDESTTDSQWTTEEAEQWHKNKQWSKDETAQWQDNKQWSKEESAAWHEDQNQDQNENQNQNTSNPPEQANSKTNSWPENNEWKENSNQQWDNSDNKKWPDGSDK
ncbi:MAG: ATP-binding cassette domain-containing protein [Gammaproteobacteria bacterium]|nr:ATP-binding cassette domain-containing protein [Gammaproteobacteria bacterium]